MFTCPKQPRSEGFRVSIHDSARAFRLKLEGALTAGGVPEVEACWRTAASTIAGREFIVDLSGVTAADMAGEELLARMRAGGARLLPPPERRDRPRTWRDFPLLVICWMAAIAAWARRPAIARASRAG